MQSCVCCMQCKHAQIFSFGTRMTSKETHRHTQTHTHTRARARAHTHTHTHTHAHTYTHIHTRAYTRRAKKERERVNGADTIAMTGTWTCLDKHRQNSRSEKRDLFRLLALITVRTDLTHINDGAVTLNLAYFCYFAERPPTPNPQPRQQD